MDVVSLEHMPPDTLLVVTLERVGQSASYVVLSRDASIPVGTVACFGGPGVPVAGVSFDEAPYDFDVSLRFQRRDPTTVVYVGACAESIVEIVSRMRTPTFDIMRGILVDDDGSVVDDDRSVTSVDATWYMDVDHMPGPIPPDDPLVSAYREALQIHTDAHATQRCSV